MLLPISRNALFRLLTGYSHHPESRLLTMTEIVVVKFRQFTLTVFTCGMEKHDDRGSLHAVITEYGTRSAIDDLNGKGRQTIPYPDDARSVRISRIMVIVNNAAKQQKIFFDGQIYDAFSLITSIIRKALKEIILIDGYVDVNTLNILAKKNANVDVYIYTYAGTPLTNRDAANFNAQYPTLTVNKTQVFHDRFIILDRKMAYHIGASIKDAGKKCFGISLIDDSGIVTDLLKRLNMI